jgi:hypothetical protein
VAETKEQTMRNNQNPTTLGEGGTSKDKADLREMDRDGKWKGEALKDAEQDAKQARRPGATDEEKTDGLAVPKSG